MKAKETLTKFPGAALPELLDFIPLLLPGKVGLILPFIGKVYLNYKDNEDSQKQIDKLKMRISHLEEREQEKVRIELNNIYNTYNNVMVEANEGCSEIYSVNCFKIVLQDDEYIIDCLEKLTDALNEDYYFAELVDNIFSIDNGIIVNLLNSEHRRNLNDALLEIEEIINEVCEYSWGKIAIKKIIFY